MWYNLLMTFDDIIDKGADLGVSVKIFFENIGINENQMALFMPILMGTAIILPIVGYFFKKKSYDSARQKREVANIKEYTQLLAWIVVIILVMLLMLNPFTVLYIGFPLWVLVLILMINSWRTQKTKFAKWFVLILLLTGVASLAMISLFRG